jgi:hypothetical protein
VGRIPQERAPAHTLDPLHHHHRRALLVHTQHVHGHDVRVLEAAGDAGLAQEARTRLALHRGVGSGDELQGHAPTERALHAGVHLSHAAHAEEIRTSHDLATGARDLVLITPLDGEQCQRGRWRQRARGAEGLLRRARTQEGDGLSKSIDDSVWSYALSHLR